jgi:hypothetical protein
MGHCSATHVHFTLVSFRVWQKKRLIVTKDLIAIGRIDDESETLLDAIPLVEVESVREMLARDDAQLDTNSSNYLNAFMITTVPGGHNSGRTYYLQTSSSDSYIILTRRLQINTKHARKRAEFNTRFSRSQYHLRKIFNSALFQFLSALLIILVRPRIFYHSHSRLYNVDALLLQAVTT